MIKNKNKSKNIANDSLKKKKEDTNKNITKREPAKNVNRKNPKKPAKKGKVYYDNVSPREVKIIPLGGLEQIGMNMTAFEYANTIIVVDAGLAFPSDDMPGIDLVVPDTTYLEQNADRVRGFFITHGHEDHIGALPYVLQKIQAPVYATPLTKAIIEHALEEHFMTKAAKVFSVLPGDVISAGDFKVEFIHTNHSITDAAALAITSPAGVILHTGDFKIDYTPVHGEMADLKRFAALGKEGVLAVLADSTNALRPGFTPSEQTIADFFDNAFNDYPKNRILIGTFASNLDRMQQIMLAAEKHHRKVAVEGRSMVTIVELAKELGYLTVPEDVLIDMETISQYPDNRLCIIMTGSQGEAMSALNRVSMGQHRRITITPNDVVIFSSTPIPGNEKAVSKVINELARRGAKIINRATHVSGHACEEEIKLIYALTSPQYAVPVHGEYRHREANAEIAKAMRVKKENVFLIDSGDILTLSKQSGRVTGHIPHGGILVDGLGVGDVGNVVLKDRQNLSQDGIVILSLAVSSHGELVGGPEVVSRGFIYSKGSEDIPEAIRALVEKKVRALLKKKNADTNVWKKEIKEAVSDYIWKTLQRKPVILPFILEVEV